MINKPSLIKKVLPYADWKRASNDCKMKMAFTNPENTMSPTESSAQGWNAFNVFRMSGWSSFGSFFNNKSTMAVKPPTQIDAETRWMKSSDVVSILLSVAAGCPICAFSQRSTANKSSGNNQTRKDVKSPFFIATMLQMVRRTNDTMSIIHKLPPEVDAMVSCRGMVEMPPKRTRLPLILFELAAGTRVLRPSWSVTKSKAVSFVSLIQEKWLF